MTKDIIEKNIENSYLLGCVKYKGNFTFYLMPIAYWILNYAKYDPAYNPNDWNDVFRDNILNVDDDKIELFINSIDTDKIDIVLGDVKEHKLQDIFLFFIDFDLKLFISYFDDISIEEYLPDNTWTGRFDNPVGYLPESLQSDFV
ncbi:hypothetical protein QEG73_19705 [Chitinophagaceae bacterium 26-R-25]|nr:hypothetical protein [Chitinophagaceae bacterium 26-R-25]